MYKPTAGCIGLHIYHNGLLSWVNDGQSWVNLENPICLSCLEVFPFFKIIQLFTSFLFLLSNIGLPKNIYNVQSVQCMYRYVTAFC